MEQQAEQSAKADNKRRMYGVVVSRPGDKTVSVEIARPFRHPLYRKQAIRTTRYLAHDPLNTTEVGMEVTICESRPLSARKRWVIETVHADKTTKA